MLTRAVVYCFALVLAQGLIGAKDASGIVTIISGVGSRGTDIGQSPDLNLPPTDLDSNVLYEAYDLTATPVGRTDFTNGWSSSAWSMSENRLFGGGSSKEGFNGARGSTGWIYGRGHAEVTVTFSVDQPYHYTAALTGDGATGVHPGTGFFQPGVHTISGQTVGNQGGFSFDVVLTPGAVPTPEDILRDSVQLRVNGARIIAEFKPANGLSLEAAAEALGVKEFNWVQSITHVPEHWDLRVVESGLARFQQGLPITLPITDPVSIPGWAYKVTTQHSPDSFMEIQTDVPPDDQPFYWNVGAERQSHEGLGAFLFKDIALQPDDYMLPGDYVGFNTMLVGVRSDGSFVAWSNLRTNFNWKTNAVFSGAGGVFGYGVFKWSDEATLPPIIAGGVFDVQFGEIETVIVPEPSTLGSGVALVLALAGWGRRPTRR